MNYRTLFFSITFFMLVDFAGNAQLVVSVPDTICGHPFQKDESGKTLAWYEPEVPGAAFHHVVKLASEFIKSGTPVDPATGKKLYFISCCFQGPHMRSKEDFERGITWEGWMHNPACVFSGLVQSLALDYRVFSGDQSYLDIVKEMLDFQLRNGTTPSDWEWPNVPYASSNPGDTVYFGATKWEDEGMRGDGLHGIEPDKVGELGIAYLKFFQITEDPVYLEAAVHCADALARHVREIPSDLKPFSSPEIKKSPWPFRVNARSGVVISEYCSNVIENIRLFDELIRTSDRIGLTDTQKASYRKVRDLAWNWSYSKSGPMKTFIWNAYFEDIPNDPERSNRIQITPMETARYLLKNPGLDPDIQYTVPALLNYVATGFSTENMDAIKEQTWCYEPMGSHTARYASICALWYEMTGDEKYKEEAYRYFNFATYMTFENGVVAVGPNWPGSWFSDGYGDYIRHFMEGIAAVPEWAPAGEDHLLKSKSVVQDIDYQKEKIYFKTYDDNSSVVMRLSSEPKSILVNGKPLSKNALSGDGWSWEKSDRGGIARIKYSQGSHVAVTK